VRVAASVVVLVALAAFVPLLFLAIRASRRAKAAGETANGPPPARPRGQVTGLAAVGVAVVVIAVAAGVAVDPSALAGVRTVAAAAGGAGDVAATGETTTVRVQAANMRFTPDVIEVPAGNRLVIEVTNTDPATVHDLVLASGPDSGRLAPGESATVDAGVIGGDVDGWCSVVGHRQMGMTLTITATGAPQASAPAGHEGHGSHATGTAAAGDAADDLDFAATPGAGFTAHDPVLPPLTSERVHRLTLRVSEVEREVAVGVRQRLWTFNGTAPGPVLRGRVGDTFDVTLRNDASMGHSVDFHAGVYAPDEAMRTVAPGDSIRFSFKATRAGIWMYHCSTMPMSLHIANGMFGAVIIDPPGLAPVAQEYVVVQSELYLGAQGGTADPAKVAAGQPDAVVFNGFANQYDHDPLTATTGDHVRIWVLDAGLNRATSFHLVGGQLDTVFKEGAYLLRQGQAGSVGGAQALDLEPGQGGFVELTAGPAGHYPFVSHLMVDAERGAHGVLAVSP
jgi:nitrite reductase (NO-forming)